MPVPEAAPKAAPLPDAAPAAAVPPGGGPTFARYRACDRGRAPARRANPRPRRQHHPLNTHWDWTPIAQVPQDLRDLTCQLCEGRYMDPLADEDDSGNPDDADIEAASNSTELQGDLVHFTAASR